jgi:hypothetical protein
LFLENSFFHRVKIVLYFSFFIRFIKFCTFNLLFSFLKLHFFNFSILLLSQIAIIYKSPKVFKSVIGGFEAPEKFACIYDFISAASKLSKNKSKTRLDLSCMQACHSGPDPKSLILCLVHSSCIIDSELNSG